jgi:uncharacterized membrane protein YhhN
MNKKALMGLFFLALAVDLVCIYWKADALRFVTKPLLAIALLGYFFSRLRWKRSPWKWWIAGALGFSWLGDVLLLFEDRAALFFILGLSAFLLAHVCYSSFFNKVRRREGIKANLVFLSFVAIYYAALMRLLTPRLGSLKLPVWVYGLVICIMFWLAMHLYILYQHNAGLLMLTGALLFVLSDSALAVNKFYEPVAGAGVMVMLTYGVAQWCITEGSIRWLLNQPSSHKKKIFASKRPASV